jgi:pimeloyl-ACP methyl ester carboxylesterase
VFDDFAPQLTDQFHVLALTRRGFGTSSKPTTGYDPASLAKDILGIIDNLGIERITLIGHSIAGEEMTKFAALYPGRVNKLIYIDAAADRTAEIDMNLVNKLPRPPAITKEDSASVKNGQAYLYRLLGVTINEADIRAGSVYDKDGRYLRDINPDFVVPYMIQSIERPAYQQIQAPALAFFNVADSARDNFPFYETLDSAQRAVVQECFDLAGKQYLRDQIDMFKKEVAKGEVIEIHRGNHYLFISNETEVAKEIRKFLERK